MALTIEDGTGVAGANTYLSEDEFAAYASARGKIITGSLEQLIIQAMDYVETLRFRGQKNSSDQALQWPRVGATRDGYELSSTTIPSELKDGVAEVALSIQAGDNPLATLSRETKREKVGDLEVEYSMAASQNPVMQAARAKLDKLVQGGGMTIRV